MQIGTTVVPVCVWKWHKGGKLSRWEFLFGPSLPKKRARKNFREWKAYPEVNWDNEKKNNREPARANCEDVWDRKEVRQEKKVEKKNKENDRKLERDPECFFFLRYCCVRKCVLLRRGKTVKNVNNKEAGEQKSFVEKSAEPRSGKLAGKILKKKKTPSSLCALFLLVQSTLRKKLWI